MKFVRFLLHVRATGVMNVITAADAAGKEKHMSTFTIDADNSITAYASAEEANQGEAASQRGRSEEDR